LCAPAPAYPQVVAQEGLKLLGWRAVPIKAEVVGRFAKATQPRIWQVRARAGVLWVLRQLRVLWVLRQPGFVGAGSGGPVHVLDGCLPPPPPLFPVLP